jgi:predicted nucleotidyltransferase component of viral defense system
VISQSAISKLSNRLYQEAIERVGRKLARRIPRDLYDLWYLLREGHIQHPEEVVGGLSTKLTSRDGRERDVLVPRLERVEAALRAAWEKRLGAQVEILPAFDESFREVRRLMRNFDELRGHG